MVDGNDRDVCVCDVTSGLGLNQSTVSHQPKLLKDAGLSLSRNAFRYDGDDTCAAELLKLMKLFVLFVCKHNTGRSQMAEAYLRTFVGDGVEVASAGTVAADVLDPGVANIMAEDGIDISCARPKLLDPEVAARATRIITMGCDVAGVPRIDADWELPDPKGQPTERVRGIRDLVRGKALELARELTDITIAGTCRSVDQLPLGVGANARLSVIRFFRTRARRVVRPRVGRRCGDDLRHRHNRRHLVATRGEHAT